MFHIFRKEIFEINRTWGKHKIEHKHSNSWVRMMTNINTLSLAGAGEKETIEVYLEKEILPWCQDAKDKNFHSHCTLVSQRVSHMWFG